MAALALSHYRPCLPVGMLHVGALTELPPVFEFPGRSATLFYLASV